MQSSGLCRSLQVQDGSEMRESPHSCSKSVWRQPGANGNSTESIGEIACVRGDGYAHAALVWLWKADGEAIVCTLMHVCQ
jgi:hypothetical protein